MYLRAPAGSITIDCEVRECFMLPNLRSNPAGLQGRHVLRVFALYLSLQILILPFLASVALLIFGKPISEWDANVQRWFSMVAMFTTFFSVLAYALFLQKRGRLIWERSPASPSSRALAFFAGVVSWLIAIPCVALIQWIVSSLMEFFVTAPPIEQVAVTHLRDTLGDPWLFTMTLLAIVVLVPVTEELLFRGFLQNWMTHHWPAKGAILTTSAIFTLFHFSFVQGWTNVPILSSLFVLSVLLGVLFQRFGSLWAPIGLHCTFNAASAFMIAY
jgi:membrane protease YdiL (CAAX protease family)